MTERADETDIRLTRMEEIKSSLLEDAAADKYESTVNEIDGIVCKPSGVPIKLHPYDSIEILQEKSEMMSRSMLENWDKKANPQEESIE